MTWAFAAIAAALLVRSDAASAPLRLQVIFLGQGPAHQDPGYLRLQRGLQERHAALAARIDFAFASVSDEDDEEAVAVSLRAVRDRPPALLVASNGHFASAARRYAPAVPLVFGTHADPVSEGVVSSMLRRPEPATGVWIANDLDAKRLEILRDAYPRVHKVAVIGDEGWSRVAHAKSVLAEAAAQLGLQITIFLAETPQQALVHLQRPEAAGFDAWYIPRTGATVGDTQPMMDKLHSLQKPMMLAETAAVRAGAPLSYAVDPSFAWPALVDLSARVLAGEHAGDIPIERPPRVVLAVRTGLDTGLPPPSISVVRRADLVIR